ncbi:unnamed protein product, partial [Callosobruchus maculatus]
MLRNREDRIHVATAKERNDANSLTILVGIGDGRDGAQREIESAKMEIFRSLIKQMEVNRLLGDELTYELEIRGLPITGTVAEKRTLVRDIFRAEHAGETAPPDSSKFPSQLELEVCEKKLKELRRDIENFDFANKDNEHKRIYSRLLHIRGRLNRIKDSEVVSIRNVLLRQCHELFGELELAYSDIDNPTGQSTASKSILDQPVPTDQPVPLRPNDSEQTRFDREKMEKNRICGSPLGNISVSSNAEDNGDRLAALSLSEAPTCGNTYNPNRKVTNTVRFPDQYEPSRYPSNRVELPYRSRFPVDYSLERGGERLGPCPKNPDFSANFAEPFPRHPHFTSYDFEDSRVDVSRWRIQYDGIGSVTSFLERLEELRQSRGVSKERLLKSAPELFTKDALLWHRMMGPFRSWDDLTESLRNAFQPHDYEESLWDEIRRRTQGSQEKVVVYLSVMENLFKKLPSVPPEDTRVQIIRRNMLPYIQTQLALYPIKTVGELLRLAKGIEETAFRVQKFCPPPANTRQLLEPELAYHRPIHNRNTAISEIRVPESSPVATVTPETSSTLSVCWNCGNIGHKFRKCPQPRQVRLITLELTFMLRPRNIITNLSNFLHSLKICTVENRSSYDEEIIKDFKCMCYGKVKERQRSRDNSEGRKLSRHELIKREVVVTEPPPAQNLSEPIALRWSRIAENGLPREVVEALLLKYPTPENCGQLRAIQLNPEVAAGMANDRLARDNFNADIQHQISRALCAVGRSLTLMLEENNLPSNLREEALTPLGDAGRLLANLLNRITVARRKLVIPTLNPNVRDVLAKTTATDLLFGSDISEQIKAAKSLHTTGKELRQTAVRSQTKGAFTTSKYKKPNEGASSKTSSLNRQGPKPFRQATKQTLSRWVKETLRLSGVDTSIFKAHSTRHAASSAALRLGVSIDTILQTAGWSEKSSVFANFYNRPLANATALAET